MSAFLNQKQTQALTIAVTGLNANDNPGPGLAVIRALRAGFNADLKIIGLAYETLEPAVYLRDEVDKTYRIPYPAAGIEALKTRIKHIQEIEKIDVLIPNFDAELYNFIKIEKDLLEMGIHTFLPSHKQLIQRDKANLKAFGDENNFKVPADDVIFKASEINSSAEKLGFPLVVKGKFYDAYTVQNLSDAYNAFYKLQAKWGLPIIMQKFIKGIEINIAGLADGKGNALSVIPMRKLYITEKGKAWAGITIENENLIDLAKNFANATQWKGSFELEIMCEDNGDLYIMEVNPRFPAWVYLTAAAGQNQPKALVDLALGNPVNEFQGYKVGKMFIRYASDNIVDVEDFQKLSVFGEL
ncbi:ATP-grasp domain-containing protein [Pedobacter rhodius]|uniref:ATP-grasp domain-containing protein n=1 Tax=Pedobacter rhodius TaxID=3004098 RepID=A0ABT4KXQ4_9SPHI|nr:ATP-grasp domain-containing protein [Pedobacter sp. SJ11]MCZ4223713.1 ATP-grasp domain-containing protein [Pedobacter sp. SJ11]